MRWIPVVSAARLTSYGKAWSNSWSLCSIPRPARLNCKEAGLGSPPLRSLAAIPLLAGDANHRLRRGPKALQLIIDRHFNNVAHRLFPLVNRWNIPPELEALVVARDDACIYCRRAFSGRGGTRGQRPSWEHIVNDVAIVSKENIALCCVSCNASKGAKPLEQWLRSKFCATRGIRKEYVAAVVQAALSQRAKPESALNADPEKTD